MILMFLLLQIMVVPVVPISVPTHVSHGEKPEKFNRNDFKRWQHKMLFYLTKLNLAKFLRRMLPFVVRMRPTAKLLLRWMHESTLIFYAKTISSMDWITHYIMCTI